MLYYTCVHDSFILISRRRCKCLIVWHQLTSIMADIFTPMPSYLYIFNLLVVSCIIRFGFIGILLSRSFIPPT